MVQAQATHIVIQGTVHTAIKLTDILAAGQYVLTDALF